MRLDELVLHIPGDEFRLRFHPHLTIVGGMGMLERHALIDSLVGAMTGDAESTLLTYRDHTGRQVEVIAGGGTTTSCYADDRAPAPPIVGTMAPNPDALRSLVLVQAADLGLTASRPRPDEHPELAEARATLEALTAELEKLMNERRQQERCREELEAVDAQLHAAEDGTARREYARVLAALERVRAEGAALQSGSAGVETDRQLLESAPEARSLAERWAAAAARLSEVRARSQVIERLDEATLAQVRAFPEVVPVDVHHLVRTMQAARHERDRLDERMRDLAMSALPEPSDRRVVDLATVKQGTLWAARDRAVTAREQLEREQLSLGGLGTEQGARPMIDGIEAAHRDVEDAEAVVNRRRLPVMAASSVSAILGLLLAGPVGPLAALLIVGAIAVPILALGAPQRHLAAARRREHAALAVAGAPSYLGFHLRRVDAAVTPGAHHRLEAAAIELRLAETAWVELVGAVTVEEATVLELEVREYARSLAQLGGKAGEIEALRDELLHHHEPALARARAELVAAVAAFGLDDEAVDATPAGMLERLVEQQVALGRAARAQDELEHAETEEKQLSNRLDDLLHQLGFRDGELQARIGALDWAARRAAERSEARRRARPREEVEADLERLQADARRLRRPEWASVQPSEADGPDVDELLARRDELKAMVEAGHQAVLDLERLADRHSAMERRVASLEAKHDAGRAEAAIAELADVQQYLLAHLTSAGHAGPRDEPLPVLLDEPFLRIPAERKWELLDMLRRLGEKTQLVYLTDDPFVGAWARRRSAAGLVTLLEPVDA